MTPTKNIWLTEYEGILPAPAPVRYSRREQRPKARPEHASTSVSVVTHYPAQATPRAFME